MICYVVWGGYRYPPLPVSLAESRKPVISGNMILNNALPNIALSNIALSNIALPNIALLSYVLWLASLVTGLRAG